MNFLKQLFKRLFKSEIIELAKTTVKFIPLDEQCQNKKIYTMLIDYLTNKYGKEKAEEIIQNSEYATESQLIPDHSTITIRTKGEERSSYFLMLNNNGEIEEMSAIDPNSEEGKILYKNA